MMWFYLRIKKEDTERQNRRKENRMIKKAVCKNNKIFREQNLPSQKPAKARTSTKVTMHIFYELLHMNYSMDQESSLHQYLYQSRSVTADRKHPILAVGPSTLPTRRIPPGGLEQAGGARKGTWLMQDSCSEHLALLSSTWSTSDTAS